MKKRTKTILIVLAVAILLCAVGGTIAVRGIQKNLNSLAASAIEDVAMDRIKDGTYTGEYQVFPVAAQVEVTVKDHRIISARIVKHQNGQGSAGEAVVARAAEANSLLVDTVAGATYSSKVLLKAMQNALNKGLVP